MPAILARRFFAAPALFVFSLALVLPTAFARNKEAKPTVIDSGSFSIVMNGKRIATEKFLIEQRPEGSTATSELKVEDDSKAAQKAELTIGENGDLRKYFWRELSPGKAQEIVEPSEEFLVEHITPNPPEKPQEQPFILPPSTMVLDDYFFSHREILLWRYMAQNCGGRIQSSCKMPKVQFGVIIPRQRLSAMVTVEYAGREKVNIAGVDRELDRFTMTSDGDQWILYVDQNLKLQRILVPSANAEVNRD